MRIYFEDKSYIDISKSRSRGKYFVTVSARQEHEIIVNSVEITKIQLGELLDGVGYQPAIEPETKSAPKVKSKKETKSRKKTTPKKRASKTKAVEKVTAQLSTSKTPLDGYAEE